MKSILCVLMTCVALLSSSFVMAADSNTNIQSKGKYVLGVHGLSCPFCVIGIQKTFNKVPGVKSVDVSLKKNTVTIVVDDGICFSDQTLKSTFGKTGFSYHGIVTKPKGCR